MLGHIADEDLEQQMDRLRQFALGNMLRVAAADLAGVIPLRVVSDYLTDIAETVLASATDIAFKQLTTRHGRPQGVTGENSGFAIIGYGKLGGIELGYGSDLDLVFLHGSLDANAMTAGIDGRRQIANDLFYARMGQRLIHVLTTRTPAGVLYEVDMRLRPNGTAGQIVSSLRAFEHYQRNEAWIWEHQALLRARPIAGEPAVMAAFQGIRQSVLAQPRDQGRLRHEVKAMRAKMRAALDKSSASQFDLKQGSGGIADIEFMVQYHVLLWAHRYSDLLTWTDNLRLLEGLAAHRVLGSDSAELLSSIYQVFRAAYHRNSLQNIPGLVANSQLVEERAAIRDLWASTISDGE
jgi:glutamate-ammonia-ligase adenylyltransferase